LAERRGTAASMSFSLGIYANPRSLSHVNCLALDECVCLVPRGASPVDVELQFGEHSLRCNPPLKGAERQFNVSPMFDGLQQIGDRIFSTGMVGGDGRRAEGLERLETSSMIADAPDAVAVSVIDDNQIVGEGRTGTLTS
jgi:hypothetical protein